MPAQILITGAAGFIGQLLATRLLSSSEYHLILTDIIEPEIPKGVKHPENAKTIKADLLDPSSLSTLIPPSVTLDAIYIFHGIMSSGAESMFDLGMSVNVDSTRQLLDHLRTLSKPTRVIYASSQAVYGLPLPSVVTDEVTPTPQGSYGAEKLICEILINEYTRRRWIDGFILRFPTICVRPGKPTAAASSFLSGMIREPLDGKECAIPLKDREFRSWLCSPKTLVENLVHSLAVPSSALPSHIRHVNIPGISVTVQEMMNALEAVGGKECLDLLKEEPDEGMERILRSWPTRFDNSQAFQLGYKKDESFEQAVRDYKESVRI